jgi:hypothetical protein
MEDLKIEPIQSETQKEKLAQLPKTWQYFAFVIFIVAGILAINLIKAALNTNIETPQQAQKYLLGTWTFAQPLTGTSEPYQWERWVISEEGLTIQNAKPSDTEWGTPSRYGYEIKRDKTSDTGEWYWRLTVADTVLNLALDKNRNVTMFAPLAHMQYQLEKKDKSLK